jgi:hypothetical protein
MKTQAHTQPKSKRILGMTNTQITILAAIFGVWMIAMFAFFTALVYTNAEDARPTAVSVAQVEPTNTPRPVSTSTPVPPPTRRPTWTPAPTQTSFPTLTAIVYATSAKSVPVGVPTSAPSSSGSAPQYDCNHPAIVYNKEIHRINLNSINSFYNTWISYYEGVLQRAIADRDALAVTSAEKEISKLKKSFKADINAENASYAASVPAACR